jgi:predicted secreted hydrolase
MRRYSETIAVVFFLFITISPVYGQEWLDVTGSDQLQFPRDLYYKRDYRVQWWYFTGHLFDENGKEFGYELTFFTVHVQKRQYKSLFGVNQIYISHFTISDVAHNRFYFSEMADTGAYGFAGANNERLHVWIGHNSLDGTMQNIHMKASGKEQKIDLQLTPFKPIVLNGERGYSRKSEKSPLIASLYFSQTNLYTKGLLTLHNKQFRVKGKSWFDREISSRKLGEEQAGWDWFAIQLDDKREIMLYLLRNKDGSIDRYSSGTFVYQNGKSRHLSRDAFKVKVLSREKSDKTGALYPSQWDISIPSENIQIRITPLMRDQEVIAYKSTGNSYWEGTCRVEGSAQGRAYVELTGY